MNVNDLIIMDPQDIEKQNFVSMKTKSEGNGESDYKKGMLKLDPSLIFYFKPLNLKPRSDISRSSPFITNWMHKIPVGEENGKIKYEFIVCPRTELGIRGSTKACRFCAQGSKLYNESKAGDQIATTQYNVVKAKFYGYVPGIVFAVRDARTKQMLPEHQELNKLRVLYISKKNWNDDLLPKLDGINGDPATAIGYSAIFGNPGRFFVITATTSDWGIDGKISVSEKAETIQLPQNIIEQITEVDFDKNFKQSSAEIVNESFNRLIVNGGMKISGVVGDISSSSVPSMQGGLTASLNASLAQPPAMPTLANTSAPTIPQFDALPIPQLDTPMDSQNHAHAATQNVATPAVQVTSAASSLQDRIAKRRAERVQ